MARKIQNVSMSFEGFRKTGSTRQPQTITIENFRTVDMLLKFRFDDRPVEIGSWEPESNFSMVFFYVDQ